jgi:hypothetical protein
MIITGKVFGKRRCTFCGKNKFLYYRWQERGKTKVRGECFSCGSLDYCDNETEEKIINRFGSDMIKMDNPIDIVL